MKYKKIISILLIILTLSFNTISVFAAGSDVSLNNAYNYIFKLDPHEDLFENFKGIMPGEHREQLIVLQNTEKNKNVTIYMRAETFEEYKKFLDYMTLEIYKSDTPDGEKVLISKNTASETGALEKDIKLATMAPGDKVYITVLLDVDIKMGNSQALTKGVIRWIFSAEEEIIKEKDTTKTPDNPTDKPTDKEPTTKKNGDNGGKNPFTGENSKSTIIVAFSTIIVSCGLIFILIKKKKNKE